MDRTNTPEYQTERDFLQRMKANVEAEMAKRVLDLTDTRPDLQEEIEAYVETPLKEWNRPLQSDVDTEFHALKLEEAVIDDLLTAIEEHTYVDAILKRIRHLQEEERQIESEPGFAYLHRPEYWNDEQALSVLNHLFERWDEFAHGRRLRGP